MNSDPDCNPGCPDCAREQREREQKDALEAYQRAAAQTASLRREHDDLAAQSRNLAERIGGCAEELYKASLLSERARKAYEALL